MRTAKNVVMFCTTFPPAIGGPATQSVNLCRALLSRGIKPIVVAYGNSFSRTEPEGYPVYRFRTQYGLGPLNKAVRWIVFSPYIAFVLLKERADILHCHSVSALAFAAGATAKLLGIPRVIKFAGDWVWETLSTHELQGSDFREVYQKSLVSRLMTHVERVGLNLFDAIWTTSVFRRDNIRSLLGSDEKTVTIPNCLALDGGGYSEKAGPTVTIVSASRFIPHKRLPWLMEAYAAARTHHTRIILTGSGSPTDVQQVKDAIQNLGIEDSVTLAGILPIEKVYEIFSKADFYVSASLEEGLPNVFIEAMHYGLPILSTDVGGCREMIVDGETGFLVPPHDQILFTKRMRQLIDDTELRQQLGKKSFKRSSLYNLNDRIDEFVALYASVMR